MKPSSHQLYLLMFLCSAVASCILVFRLSASVHTSLLSLSSPGPSQCTDGEVGCAESFLLAPRLLQTQTPPRILLGIFSEGTSNERKLRHVIRRTYLGYDRIHNTTTFHHHRHHHHHRVCSLQEFAVILSSRQEDEDENDIPAARSRSKNHDCCQLVYTFVRGGNETRNETSVGEWTKQLLQNSSSSFIKIPPQAIRTKETDLLYLNTGDQHTLYKTWAWYQYANTIMRKWKDQFDFIATTDTKVRLYPVEFWEDNAFLLDKRRTYPHSKEGIYAGLSVDRTRCRQQGYKQANWCPSLNSDEPTSKNSEKGESTTTTTTMMQRFTMISKELLSFIASSDPMAFFGPVQPGESLDVPLANLLQTYPHTIQHIPLNGVSPMLPNQVSWSENLKLWDKYKDTKLQTVYEDPNEVAWVQARVAVGKSSSLVLQNTTTTTFSGPRIIMGIFTMDRPVDKQRRRILRSTYLSYYKKKTSTPHRICSLQDLLKGNVPNNGADCQLAYTFVMGGNPDGPTELLEPNATFPIALEMGPNHKAKGSSSVPETDIVYLNIRENMEDGKSQTWLKYASTILDDHQYFDYIGKTDTDTMIFPKSFLETTLFKCPTFPANIRVYGGLYRLKAEWAERQVGPIYMAGELYWMSPDLARFVTSPRCDRKALDGGVEDFSMGNFVHSHPLPIHRTSIRGNGAHKHPLKLVDDLRSEWTKYEKETSIQKEDAAYQSI